MPKLDDIDIATLDHTDLTDADFPELEGEHVSNEARFTDGEFEVIAWDAPMAMRLARANPAWPRARQLERLQDAVNDGDLPGEAVERLIDYGFPELG